METAVCLTCRKCQEPETDVKDNPFIRLFDDEDIYVHLKCLKLERKNRLIPKE